VEAQRARAGWGVLRLYGVGGGEKPGAALTVDSLQDSFPRCGDVRVVVADGPAASLVRGGPGDTRPARFSGDCTVPRLDQAPARASASSLPRWSFVVAAAIQLTDNRKGLSVTVGVVGRELRKPGLRFRVDARQVSGDASGATEPRASRLVPKV